MAALVGLAALWLIDFRRGLADDARHVQLDAYPILFIGLAYIAYQCSLDRPRGEKIKGILLGLAFAIWGSEQFLPTWRCMTVLDDIAMSIFVIDLGVIILGEYRKQRQPITADAKK
ncbi:MAG TPA: hypothetical protein VF607_10710 [Verrucomicrobiae bacterium]